MDALRSSVLVGEVGETGAAELVTVAPARSSEWSTRVIAVTRAFRHEAIRERVLLVLPVGRSPPRGAILEASVRIAEPRPEEDGFDERAWLARQGIHVVLEASSWREVGRRGGLAGFGDALRDRIERAVTRGADGTRRGIVLGVVLGEDEGLPADVQDDFRASGLYHLLAVSGQNVAFLAGGIYALGWLLRLSRRRPRALDPRHDRGVRAGGRLAAVGRAGRRRRRARIPRLARRPSDATAGTSWRSERSCSWRGCRRRFSSLGSSSRSSPSRRSSWPCRACDAARRLPGSAVVADAVAVALACGVVTAPIVLFHFGEAPLYTVLANVARVPRRTARARSRAPRGGRRPGLALRPPRVSLRSRVGLRPGSSSSLGSSPTCRARRSTLGALRSSPPSARRRLARRSTAAAARAPRAACSSRCVARRRRRRHAAAWLSTDPATAWAPPAGLRVTFLDVGQGDAVLLETPRARVLVDQGPPEADVAGQLAAWASARSRRSCSRIRSATTLEAPTT